MFAYVSYIWIARRAHSPLKNVSFARSHTTFFFFCSSHYRCPFRFFFLFLSPFSSFARTQKQSEEQEFWEKMSCSSSKPEMFTSQRVRISLAVSQQERQPDENVFFLLRDKWVCEQSHPLLFFQLVLVLLAGTLTYIQLWWFLPFFLVVD